MVLQVNARLAPNTLIANLQGQWIDEGGDGARSSSSGPTSMSSASSIQSFAASAIGGSTATDGNGQFDIGCRPHANNPIIGIPWALGVSGHSSSAATMPPLLEAARANWQSGAQPQSNASRDQLPRVSSLR
eukprot:3112750-Pyramimonas_sp.AAC.1